jgi:hypothetical protein
VEGIDVTILQALQQPCICAESLWYSIPAALQSSGVV